MIRIAHIADSHFDERNRLDDNVAVHEAFLEQVAKETVDLILHAGDVYERASCPAERNAALAFVSRARGIAPVAIVRGNHDAPGDLDVCRWLDARLSERPTRHAIGSLAVLTLPWFDRAHVAAHLPADATREDVRSSTIGAAQALLAHLRTQATQARADGLIPILVGHVQVAGSETSTGQTLIGQTVELDPGAIHEIGCEYAALGHIHMHQSWYDGRVCYAGSPQRHNFGEPEDKGWVLVTLRDGRFHSAEFRRLPARRIVLVEGRIDGPGRARFDAGVDDFRDALVRVRYRVTPEHLPTVNDDELRALFGGAAEVTLEAVVEVDDRVRCEAIVTAESMWDKVLAYLAAKQIVLDDARLERLRAHLGEIEQHARAVEVGR